MKLLVVGRSGQLAVALRALGERPGAPPAEFLGHDRCDLRESASLRAALESGRPEVVINAAAYTNVEQAEAEPAQALAVNGQGVGELALACARIGARLIHVSTDYVFDGESTEPYRPEMPPAPLNAYGASKLEGERRIAATAGLDWLVVRTSWLYSAVGRNFMLTMLGLFRSRGAASVVDDQVGSPTSAASLAEALWKAALERPQARGLVHFADAGRASWYEFAVEIGAAAHRRGLIARMPVVTPIGSADYPQRARRPRFSVLDPASTVQAWGLRARSWQDALGATLDEVARA